MRGCHCCVCVVFAVWLCVLSSTAVAVCLCVCCRLLPWPLRELFSFRLGATTLAFYSCHLNAHEGEEKRARRDSDVAEILSGARVGPSLDLDTASHKTALECAEQFADKDAGASAECVRLIEAREKELGLEGRGAGSCFWCCFILKPANICQDRLGPNIGKEDEKRRFCRRRGEVYHGRYEHQR